MCTAEKMLKKILQAEENDSWNHTRVRNGGRLYVYEHFLKIEPLKVLTMSCDVCNTHKITCDSTHIYDMQQCMFVVLKMCDKTRICVPCMCTMNVMEIDSCGSYAIECNTT